MTVCVFLTIVVLLFRWAFEEEPVASRSEPVVAQVSSVIIDQADLGPIDQTDSYGNEANGKTSEAEPSSSVREDSVAKTAERELDFAQVPLALYQPPPEAGWNDEQLDRLVVLREMFAAALGRLEQDPTNPNYRERWIQTQPWIDEQFQTIFGDEAFNRQQRQAVHHSKQ